MNNTNIAFEDDSCLSVGFVRNNFFSNSCYAALVTNVRIKGDEAMLLMGYFEDYISTGFGAKAPKKGIALRPLVKNNQKLNLIGIKKNCVTGSNNLLKTYQTTN